MSTEITRSQSLMNLLASSPKAPAPGGNRSFSPDESATVWLIERGYIDLFLVEHQGGKDIGARLPVARLEAHESLFGIEPSEGLRFIAVPGPDTVLRVIEKEDLLGEAVGDAAPYVEQLIERWVLRLSNSFAAGAGAMPREVRSISAPAEELLEPDETLVSPSAVTWVSRASGILNWCGENELSVPENCAFPLAPGAWLTVGTSLTLNCLSITSLLKADPKLYSLSAFNQFMLHALKRAGSRRQEAELTRLKLKQSYRSAAFGESLTRLSDILSRNTTTTVDDEGYGELFAALKAIGAYERLTIKPHPDAKKDKEIREPLAGILAASKLSSRTVSLTGEWYREDNGALLGYLKDSMRPVALIPVSIRAYNLFDPLTGLSTPITAAVAETLSTLAHCFYRPFPEKPLTARDLFRHGSLFTKQDFITVLLMGSAGGLLGVLTPYLTGILFDSVIPTSQKDQLYQVVLVLCVSAFAGAMFSITQAIAMLRIETRMASSIQTAVWDRLLKLPVPFFRRYSAGDLASRAGAIENIRALLSGLVVTSILSGVFSVFYFGLLFYYDLNLALWSALLIGIAIVVTVAISILQLRYEREVQDTSVRLSGRVLQFINGISKLRVSGAETSAFAIWAEEFAAQRIQQFRARNLGNLLSVFIGVFPIVANMLIFYKVADISRSSEFSTGHFLAFHAAFTSFLAAMLQMAEGASSIFMAKALYETAEPILKAVPEVREARSDPGDLQGSIELSHVAFRYDPEGPAILRDISLNIRPGEFVAFVGPSGSGKSTIFRLLLGFEEPESGSIYLDGQDLAGLDLGAVRRQFGVVLQNGKLLPGDIFTNLIGSSTTLTLDDAWRAVRMAGLAEDIESMPMGMHTVIAEGGGGLSGGQRQRLMIAKAIIHRPNILLMDEATSALDNRTQQIVSKSLENLNATRIVIAHRLSTVQNADRIAVIDGGVVKELGTFQELMRNKGLFAELAKRQIV